MGVCVWGRGEGEDWWKREGEVGGGNQIWSSFDDNSTFSITYVVAPLS